VTGGVDVNLVSIGGHFGFTFASAAVSILVERDEQLTLALEMLLAWMFGGILDGYRRYSDRIERHKECLENKHDVRFGDKQRWECAERLNLE
jgi:hypothetical protein